MKITQFGDIPQFARAGSWECDYAPDRLVITLDEWAADKNQNLDLNPDFQRGHVWTEAQQVAFLEFFFRGGKTARVIHLNNPQWHRDKKSGYRDFVLVDGKQRLQAWRRFCAKEIRVFGSYRNEFTDHMRCMFTMKVNVNDLQTRAEVLQWYLDFNSGGVVHSDEELNRVRKLLELETSHSSTAP